LGEDRKLLKIVLLCVLLSVGSLLIAEIDPQPLLEPLTVELRAELELGEKISLRETYLFRVKEEGKFRMLYRVWRVPVSYETALGVPHLRVTDFGGEGTAYLKDHYGNVFLREERDEIRDLVKARALRNELGVVRAEGFGRGDHRAFFEYLLLPPFTYDEEFMHLNLKLADRHVPYERVEIVIHDSGNLILDLYPHLPLFEVRRSGSLWIVEGLAGKDRLVELEMVLKRKPLEGFRTYVPNVRERARSANATLTALHTFRSYLKPVLVLSVLTAPYILLILYRKYGSEKEYPVPRFLSYVPNPERKPWLVNLLFHGSSVRTDENALFATLLDMEDRGFIELELTGDDVRIKTTGRVPEDLYERKVLDFVSKYTSAEGFFSSRRVAELVRDCVGRKDRRTLGRIKRDFEEILFFRDDLLVKGFLSTEGHQLIKRVGIVLGILLGSVFTGLLLVSSLYPLYVYDLLVLCAGGILLANLPHLLLPPQILGRWKGEYYRERLEWEAFRNFLSDLAMIKKYAPADMAVWREWLLYGVALGVGDRVGEAMKELRVSIPQLPRSFLLRYQLHRTFSHINSSYRSVQVSSGGGFGAGGGFGGGGAGGR